MDFNHSEDRRMLADTLGRYLEQRYAMEARHRISATEQGWSSDHWTALAELGVIGALFSEASGGFGGGGFDIGVLFEQIGKALVVEPFLGTLMAGRVLARAGGRDALLQEIIAGSVIVTFAHEEPQSRYDLANIAVRATQTGHGWALSGTKSIVPQAETADQILVSARISGTPGEEKGIGIFLVAKAVAGYGVQGYPLIDGGRAGEVSLAATPATLVAENGFDLIEDAVAAGIVALCWEAVGVMDTLKAATLDYLRTRQQFGVPIGKFQALQHRMATAALEIEQGRSAAINAAAALDQPRVKRERAISAAKFTVGRVGTLVVEEAIQMHGAIGMTWELPLAHFAKRLTMIGHQLGDEDHHLARFVELGRQAA